MAARYSLHNIEALRGRRVFFDANILIYIFWPTGSFNWEKKYSSAYGKLLKQQNELVIDFLVISEFVNRAMRIEHDKYTKAHNYLSYKKYRDSDHGRESLQDIYTLVNDVIVKKFIIIGKTFLKADIESFLQVDNLDFNDKTIIPLCTENNLVLITNDNDFAQSDIEIASYLPTLAKN
mgnify:CR=1 FL=1